MKKKTLLIVLSILLISIFSISTTIAFMTSKETDNNTFTIGNVSIKLVESKVDELGNKTGEETSITNVYHLMPGYTYTKDPTIIVEDKSSDSYVRILITLNNVSKIKDIYGEDFSLEDIYSNWGENWIYTTKKDNSDGTITYEYRYKDVVDGENGDIKLEPLFTEFTVPGQTTRNELENLQELKVTIKGQAIQAASFKNADEAWKGFVKQYSE